jgi:pilus assembly protein CpaE
MPELSIVNFTADDEQRVVLQMLVDSTAVAKTVHSFSGFPRVVTDPLLRRTLEAKPDAVIVEIPSHNASEALHAIELIHRESAKVAVIAIGEVEQPQMIIAAMRAGAREFIARPATVNHLLEAFVRLTSSQRKTRGKDEHGKVITVLAAKGGCGATSIAVNIALSLQTSFGDTVLVDLAPLGHAAIHLNVKPKFTVLDAARNSHRLDAALLEGYLTDCVRGLHLLAGTHDVDVRDEPGSSSDCAHLFDVLVSGYKYVVVDASARIDSLVRVVCDLSDAVLLVANPDVVSLWSATKIHRFLEATGIGGRVHLILNRYRKLPGFRDADAEETVGAKLLWKIPEEPLFSYSVDKGIPLTQQNHSEIAKSFSQLSAALIHEKPEIQPRSFMPWK